MHTCCYTVTLVETRGVSASTSVYEAVVEGGG